MLKNYKVPDIASITQALTLPGTGFHRFMCLKTWTWSSAGDGLWKVVGNFRRWSSDGESGSSLCGRPTGFMAWYPFLFMLSNSIYDMNSCYCSCHCDFSTMITCILLNKPFLLYVGSNQVLDDSNENNNWYKYSLWMLVSLSFYRQETWGSGSHLCAVIQPVNDRAGG